jgi:hypothetical protein
MAKDDNSGKDLAAADSSGVGHEECPQALPSSYGMPWPTRASRRTVLA